MIYKTEPLNGLPAFGGTIGFARVVDVQVEENGVDPFIYDADGERVNNYVLCYCANDGSIKNFNNLEDFAHMCGLDSEDGKVLRQSLFDIMSRFPFIILTKEIPAGKMDIFLDARTYHLAMNDEKAKELEQLSETQIAQINEQIEMHLVVQNVFAKLAEIVQKRFNDKNFNEKAETVANFIAEIRYWNDNGEIVALNLNALDNFWTKVKANLRIW